LRRAGTKGGVRKPVETKGRQDPEKLQKKQKGAKEQQKAGQLRGGRNRLGGNLLGNPKEVSQKQTGEKSLTGKVTRD